MKLFGTSGIRQLADRKLFQVAFEVGLAVGSNFDKVVVGRDTRTTGDAIKHAVISGLLAGGSDCSDAGILPTPTLAFAAREFKAAIMITASHNPPEYNGIKILNPDGSAFSPFQQSMIEESVSKGTQDIACWDKIRNSGIYPDAIEKHVKRILNDFPACPELKVVIDCGCGAAHYITPYLLERMGCEVIPLNCHPDGNFPRNAEPVVENLSELIKAVKESGADLGIAHDGDADRMMAVDDEGRFIPGDKMLAILALSYDSGRVVTTIDASMLIDTIGRDIVRTRVGDPYVSEELKNGGRFGGEPSGAWVFSDISFCPDGVYAAAKTIFLASQRKLSKLVDDLPSYPVIRGSVSSSGVDIGQLESRLSLLNPLTVSKIDGIKLNFSDGWLLIRRSGTEPKIRVSVEARIEKRARQIYDSAVDIIKTMAQDSARGKN